MEQQVAQGARTAEAVQPQTVTPQSQRLAALDKLSFAGLPIDGPATLRTQPQTEREFLKSAIQAAEKAMPPAAEASSQARFTACAKEFSRYLREHATGPEGKQRVKLAEKVDQLLENHLRWRIGREAQSEGMSPEVQATVRRLSNQAGEDFQAGLQELTEKNSLFLNPGFAIEEDKISRRPITQIDGVLEFRAGGKDLPVCLYSDPVAMGNGCVVNGGLTLVNLAQCKFGEPGGEAWTKSTVANELAHAYLMRAKDFHSDGELTGAVTLPDAPKALDERARKDLAGINISGARQIHELISDHWGSAADAGFTGDSKRLLSIVMGFAGDRGVGRKGLESQEAKFLDANATPYALSATVVLRTLESIDRTGDGRLGLQAEIGKMQEITDKVVAVGNKYHTLVGKTQKLQELANELAEFVGGEGLQEIFNSLGSPERDKVLAGFDGNVRKKAIEAEAKMQEVVGGSKEDLKIFRQTVNKQIAAVRTKFSEVFADSQRTCEEVTAQVDSKLTAEDRQLIRSTLAHYGKYLMSTIKDQTKEELKLPSRPAN